MTTVFNVLNKNFNFQEFVGYSGKFLILKEAQERNIDYQLFSRGKKDKHPTVYIRLKKGNQFAWISPDRGYFNPKPSCELALYKYLTSQVLKSVNLPIPKFAKIRNLKELNQIKIQPPWVAKPVAQAEGKDVLVGLKDKKELQGACSNLFKKYRSLMIEEFALGQDFRLLILENKLLGAVKRIPPRLKGNGTQTIRQLIENSNKKERCIQPKKFEPFLKPLKIDLEMKRCLAQQNLDLETIPKKGQTVQVRKNANFSTGGEIEDVTGKVHPENTKIAQEAVKALGLKLGGVDIAINDISKPISENNGKIIEINGIPSLWLHHYPNHGQGRNVAGEIIDYLFK